MIFYKDILLDGFMHVAPWMLFGNEMFRAAIFFNRDILSLVSIYVVVSFGCMAGVLFYYRLGYLLRGYGIKAHDGVMNKLIYKYTLIWIASLPWLGFIGGLICIFSGYCKTIKISKINVAILMVSILLYYRYTADSLIYFD